MMGMDYITKIVEFHPYRTARVLWSVVFDLEEIEIKFLKKYIEDNDHFMGNHICWKNEQGVCFMYSDHRLYVGNKIVEERWP